MRVKLPALPCPVLACLDQQAPCPLRVRDVRMLTFYSLVCDAPDRLGKIGGATQIKQHPFFRGVNWDGLRRIRAPFEPKLQSAVDTTYFPIDEIPQQDNSAALRAQTEATQRADEEASMSLPFIGYTYKRFDAFRGS